MAQAKQKKSIQTKGLKKQKQISKSEKEFVEHYLRTGNALESYKVAYPNANENTALKNSYSIIRRPHIAEYINNNKTAIEVERKIDREYLIKEALELIESCKSTDDMNPIKDKTNWGKGIDLLAKLTNAYAPIRIETKQEIVIKFDFDISPISNDNEVIDITPTEDDE